MDAILLGVASMRGLPLIVEAAVWTGPDMLTLAERELAAATRAQRAVAKCFAGACRQLGQANRRTQSPLRAGGPCAPISAEMCRRERSQAMGWLNSRRPLLRKADRRLAAARAALVALAS